MSSVKFYLAMIAAALCLFSCNDADEAENAPAETKKLWGTTYSHTNLGAYPDLFSKYWVYAYDIKSNPNAGLRITGRYPQARFFSFSVYNDLRGEVIDGLDDVNITPDNGSENPYRTTSKRTDNRFTIYLLKKGTDLSFFPGAREENVCYFTEDVACVSICLRQYLGVDEFGGVELPLIEGVDLRTGQTIEAPEPVVSKATIMKEGNYEPLESDSEMTVPFLLAPRGEYFPNNSTDYLYCRTRLERDQVLAFSFIPVPIPATVEQYMGAKARYWSICIGSVQNTRSYSSFYDRMLDAPEGKKITVVVASANNPKLAQVKEFAKRIPYSYVLEWDETKLDNHGNAIGDIITIMYRNILPDKSWEYSIKNMTPTAYGNPYSNVTDPSTQVASVALGDYSPLGKKYSTDDFLTPGIVVDSQPK